MNDAVFSLIYVSSAVNAFSKEDLNELLSESRRNNSRLSVTGMLLYKDGNFMQVLEGEEKVVRELYARILEDPRHRGGIRLHETRSEIRDFPDWTMGFRNLDSPEARTAPGYTDFLDAPLTDSEFAENPTRAQKLLLTFKRSM